MGYTLLRIPNAPSKTGDSRAMFYQKIKDGLLPRPISNGGRTAAWPSHELDAVIAARIAGKSDDEIRQLVKKLEADRKAMA